MIDQVGAGTFGQKGDSAGLATRNKLAELEKDGVLEMELDKSMSANTSGSWGKCNRSRGAASVGTVSGLRPAGSGSEPAAKWSVFAETRSL